MTDDQTDEATDGPDAPSSGRDEHSDRRARPRANADRYRDLFELAPEPYLLTDVDGIIRLANARTLELLDRARSDVEGHDLAEFVASESRAGLGRQLARASAGRGIHAWELHLRGATQPTVLASVEPRAAPGGGTELRWVLWDALPLELVRDRLNRLLEDSQGDAASLRALAEWQASLLGSAAQDMRTPLAVISSTIESLLEDGAEVSTPVARSMLERASRQVARLRRLLPTLLQLGRLQLEEPRCEREDLGVRQLVDEVLHELAPLGRQVTYAFEVERIHADPRQLARVLVELVTHISEHVPGTAPLRIGTEARGVDVELSVDLEGHAVPEEVRQALSSPFPGGAGGAEPTSEGLGLALVSVFARMHGGRAWVQDAPGGSSFRVLLSNGLPDSRRDDGAAGAAGADQA